MIEWLDQLPAATRKVLIHINNTNPILDEDSDRTARALLSDGIEVASLTAWTMRQRRDERSADRYPASNGAVRATNHCRTRRGVRGPAARQGHGLSHPSPVPRDDDRGQAHARADAGLGRQPLLLPDRDSASRTRPSCPTAPIATCGANGSSAFSITTATRLGGIEDEGGIEAWIRPGRGRRADARGRDIDLRHVVPGVALCGRCLRQLRAPPPWQESAVRLADRTVRAAHPPAAPGHLARALPVDRRRGPAVLPQPGDARRGATSSTAWQFTLDYFSRPARCRSARWKSCSSSSTSCGQLATPSAQPAGSPSRGRESVRPTARRHRASAPPAIRVASHFRLQWEAGQNAWVLLYPEGMVKLNESAGEILQRCDGEQPCSAIVAELERLWRHRA